MRWNDFKKGVNFYFGLCLCITKAFKKVQFLDLFSLETTYLRRGTGLTEKILFSFNFFDIWRMGGGGTEPNQTQGREGGTGLSELQ